MARPREFNEDAAVNQALSVFWEKGFEATSLTDLTSAMGISKSSLYETFGSKHQLFLAAMDRYAGQTMGWAIGVLEGGMPARQAIGQVFDFIIKTAIDDNDRRGCFLGNCAVESAGHDEQVAKRVSEGMDGFEAAFRRAVERGQKEGDISGRHDPKALARFLVGNVNGLRVATKAGAGRRHLEDVVGVVMAALD